MSSRWCSAPKISEFLSASAGATVCPGTRALDRAGARTRFGVGRRCQLGALPPDQVCLTRLFVARQPRHIARPPNALRLCRRDGRAAPGTVGHQPLVGGLRKFRSSVQGRERNGGGEGVPRSPVARRRALFPHACLSVVLCTDGRAGRRACPARKAWLKGQRR
jgi:hypothetical protein